MKDRTITQKHEQEKTWFKKNELKGAQTEVKLFKINGLFISEILYTIIS